MNFIDLKTQFKGIENDLRSRIDAVFEHGMYILGPEVAEFERTAADFVGAKHCIGLSSGTSALDLAMMALDVGPGDEVLTTPFSFFATVECIIMRGATPVFVDIDPITYNIDPQKLESQITDKTKALLVVDLYGQCANYDLIDPIAKRHGIAVVEDSAQSFGGTKNGQHACSFGDVACTSFFPSKPLGCFGDGGACFTNSDELAQKIRQLSNHGQVGRYKYADIGTNARLDTLQAAVLLAKMEVFEQEMEARQQVAAWYGKHLQLDTLPVILPGNVSAWAQYTIRVDKRDELRQKLQTEGIPTAVHYPETFMSIDVIKKHMKPGQPVCPNAEAAAASVMSLPFHPYMTEQDVQTVSEAVMKNIAALGCVST